MSRAHYPSRSGGLGVTIAATSLGFVPVRIGDDLATGIYGLPWVVNS
jgi:hypothetical protein